MTILLLLYIASLAMAVGMVQTYDYMCDSVDQLIWLWPITFLYIAVANLPSKILCYKNKKSWNKWEALFKEILYTAHISGALLIVYALWPTTTFATLDTHKSILTFLSAFLLFVTSCHSFNQYMQYIQNQQSQN